MGGGCEEGDRGKVGLDVKLFYFALGTEPTDEPLQTAEERRGYLMEMVGEWHPNMKRLLEGADHGLSACVGVLSSKTRYGDVS